MGLTPHAGAPVGAKPHPHVLVRELGGGGLNVLWGFQLHKYRTLLESSRLVLGRCLAPASRLSPRLWWWVLRELGCCGGLRLLGMRVALIGHGPPRTSPPLTRGDSTPPEGCGREGTAGRLPTRVGELWGIFWLGWLANYAEAHPGFSVVPTVAFILQAFRRSCGTWSGPGKRV